MCSCVLEHTHTCEPITCTRGADSPRRSAASAAGSVGEGGAAAAAAEDAKQDRANERIADRERRKGRRDRFMRLASKMRVDQMLEKIKSSAQLDSDYVFYLIIAGVRRMHA